MGQLEKKVMTNLQKVAYVVDGLTKGVSRDILADDLGYKDYKGMDIFLNRNGYKWNKQRQNYEARETVKNTKIALVPQGKIDQVVRFIAAGKDIKETAVLAGFGEVQSLATFMLAKGYVWDDESENYVKRVDVEEDSTINVEDMSEEDAEKSPIASNDIGTGIALSLEEQILLKQALPLLQQLLDNKDTFGKLMNYREIDEESTLPRFKIPGKYMTKSVHMSDLMDQMTKDYSTMNNVSQKILFEVALVEFFRKHGYNSEINTLLGV